MTFSLFRNLSINKKLAIIIIFSCLFVSLMTSALFVGRDIISLRQSMIEDLSGLARVIGINCRAPLEFMDTETAGEVLSSLSARPHILQAVLYSHDGQVFAQYSARSVNSRNERDFNDHLKIAHTLLLEESHHFHKDYIDLTIPIGDPGKIIGAIVLKSDQDEFYAILVWLLYAVCGIFVATLLLALFFSAILNKVISQPILALAETMERVRREENYAVRADKTSGDELGVLVEGVNSMLAGIEHRDEQLLVAKKVAEDASFAKSQFLAQMSHEIRTPMNGVLGIAALLMHTSLNEKQSKFVRTIRNSGESLLNLINDILDFSKIEAGKLELELLPFYLRDMIEETVELLSEHALEKDVNLACFVDSNVPSHVTGDSGRLRQVLMNLLGNALKFTSHGEVLLFVSEEKSHNNEVCLRFEIRDSGIGIKKEKQKDIFAAFSQADEYTTRKFGGTGLGLAICHQLVNLMGGEIGVESVEGEGATFWFTTVFSIGGVGELIKDEQYESSAFQKFDAFVLVVEDNLTNQIVAEGTLEKMGCKVDVTDNGIEAMAAVEKTQYDLIFMDCQMPVMDGYKATEEIRKIETEKGTERVPIVALTAHAMKGDRERCFDVGMDDYIAKPFREPQLAKILSKWLIGK